MLKSITWAEYISFITALALVYYAFIIFLYYKSEIKLLLSGKIHLIALPTGRKLNSPNSGVSTEPQHSTTELINILSATIQSAASNFSSKTELIEVLKDNLDGHAQLQDDVSRGTIINFITRESRNQCSIHLSEEDLRGLLKKR